jgi:hypothetical protein
MKKTFNVEIEMDEFYPLYEMSEDETELTDTVVFSQEDFFNSIRDIIISELEDMDIIDRHYDEWPEDWQYLSDCAKNLKITVDGKEVKIWQGFDSK